MRLVVTTSVLVLSGVLSVLSDSYSVEEWIEAALKSNGKGVLLETPDFKSALMASPRENAKRLANLIRTNPDNAIAGQCVSALHKLGTLDSEYELIKLTRELIYADTTPDSMKIQLLDSIAEKGIISSMYIRSLGKIHLNNNYMMDHMNDSLIPGYKDQLERNSNIQRNLLEALGKSPKNLQMEAMLFYRKLDELFSSKCVIGMHEKSLFLNAMQEIRPKVKLGEIMIYFCKNKQTLDGQTLAFVFGKHEYGIVFCLAENETHYILESQNISLDVD